MKTVHILVEISLGQIGSLGTQIMAELLRQQEDGSGRQAQLSERGHRSREQYEVKQRCR